MTKTSMSSIWAGRLYKIEEEIRNTEAGKDGRLMQLCKKKEKLEKALSRTIGEEL